MSDLLNPMTGLQLYDAEPEDIVVCVTDKDNNVVSMNTSILDVSLSVKNGNVVVRMDSEDGTIKFEVSDMNRGIRLKKELDTGSELSYTVFHRWNSLTDELKKYCTAEMWKHCMMPHIKVT